MTPDVQSLLDGRRLRVDYATIKLAAKKGGRQVKDRCPGVRASDARAAGSSGKEGRSSERGVRTAVE